MRVSRAFLVSFVFLVSYLVVFSLSLWIEVTSEGQGQYGIWVESNSHSVLSLQCVAGDVIVCEFSVDEEGGLFPGDQTKYDLWTMQGIDVFLLDDSDYDAFIENGTTESLIAYIDVPQGEWGVRIQAAGTYHIVYRNDSIYRKHIQIVILVSSQLVKDLQVFSSILGSLALVSALVPVYWQGNRGKRGAAR